MRTTRFFKFLCAIAALAIGSLACAQRAVNFTVTGNQINGTGDAKVVFVATGGEAALGFTVTFDPAVLRYNSFTNGTGLTTSSTVFPNEDQANAGKVGFLINRSFTQAFTAGSYEILVLNFTVLGTGASATALGFDDSLSERQVNDLNTNPVSPAATFNGLTIAANLPPSAPVFTNSATNATFVVGQTGSFQFTASGFPAATFSTASALPSGVTLSTSGLLTGAPTTFTGSPFTLAVVATNSAGSANQTFTLTVTGAPTITTQPVDRTIAVGNSTTFTVAASGSPAPTYQWQIQEPGSSAWNNVPTGTGSQFSGATTATLTLNATDPAFNGFKVRAVASNGVGTAATSNAALITVLYPPIVSISPASQTVGLNSTVTLTALVGGNPAPTLRWQKSTNGGGTWTNVDDVINKISGATTATLQIQGAVGTDAGSYRVAATNSQGSANSNATTLDFNAGIATGGTSPTTGSPGTVVTINGAGFTGATAVRFNGLSASFTIVSPYQITAVVPTFATTGTLTVVTASNATLNGPDFTVVPGPRFANLRSIGQCDTGEGALMANFTIEGTGTKAVLIRAPGPALGGTGTLADPVLTIYDAAGTQIGFNDDWNASLAATFTAVGAPGFTTGSKDAALVMNLAPGTYTARVTGKGATGFSMVEVFEADTVTTSRLAHMARRAPHTSGNNNTNFKLTGAGTSTVLVRAVGAGLGLPGTLASPTFIVSTGATIQTLNTNSADIAAATTAVGAMPLGANGLAALVTLPAGDHNVSVASTASTGLVMTEIFIVDSFRPEAFAPALLAPLQPKAANLNDTVVFASPFVAKPAPTFQWQKDTVDLPGQTGATLTLAHVTSVDTASYRVVLTNASGPVITGAAQLDVNKAAQTITFGVLADRTFAAGATFPISASSTSGLPITFVSLDGGIATVGAGTTTSGITTATVTIVGAGTTSIVAKQAGNADFQAATDVSQQLKINKATATIALSNTTAVYDGNAKPVTASTSPDGLTVALTYAGSPTAPSNAGTYAVVATIVDNNYQGTQNGTLTIAKGDQVIAFSAVPTDKVFGNGTFTLTATGGASGNPVTFSSSNTAVATVSNNVVTIVGAGTTTLTAAQAGNGNYNPANPFPQTFNVAKADQTITFGPLANKTFGDSPITLAATASSGLTPTYTVLSGPATISGTNTLNITGAGTVNVRAAQIGNTNYNAAPTVDQSFVVAPANQTITFTLATSIALDQSPVALVATSNGGPVTFSLSNPSTGTVATLSGSTLTLVNTGTIDVTASAAANANFNAATPVTRTLTVTGQSQTITFDATQLPAKTFSPGQTFTISAATNRTGYLIAFASSDTNVATVAPGTLGADGKTTTATVTIVGAGTATITATQAGDANTGTATPIPRTLTVAKAAQTISFGTIAPRVFGDADFTVTATASSNLPVAYSSSNTAVATVNSTTGLVHIVGAGSAVITAAQAGNTNYNAATSVNQTLTVAKAAQTITGLANTTKLINAGSFTLGATASSTLAVTYTSSNSAVATVSGNAVTIVGLGTTTLTASQAGDANYNAATPVTATLTVNPVAPQIVNAPATVPAAIRGSAFVYGPLTLNALSAPATFTATGLPAGLTINGVSGNISGTPTVEGTFAVTITVTNATSTDTKSISIVVQPPAPAITSPAAASAVAGTAFTYTATATPATGVTFTAPTRPAWLNFSGATLSGTPTEAGTYTVPITATNATGAVTLPLVINVTLPANAPVYSGTLNPSGTAGVAFNFTPNFGPGTTTYAMPTGTLPTGLNFSTATGAITGTTQVVGVFPVTITATRAGLTATANLNVTINPAASAPVVNFGSGGNVRIGTKGTAISVVNLTASPAATSFTIGTLPGGLTVGGTAAAPTISGTPNVTGTFNVAVSATNSAGTGPASILQFTINPGANAPVITSAPVVQGRVNVALSYTVTASPASPAATFGVTGTVPGMNLSGNTFSGTPTASGSFTVFFAGTNTDPAGGTGEAMDVVFNIAPPLTVPVINSNGTAAGQVGQAFNYAITATNSPTSFAATGLPVGLSLNTSSGVISGVPTTATSGTPVTVTLTASNGDGASNPKSLLITIAPAPATPVITSAAVASGRVGQSFTYAITASETPTSYVATGLPPGLAVNPTSGVISGTPTVSGPFTASIAAANAGGVGASSPLSFTIAPAATAPVITSAGAASGQVGTAFTYAITTSGGTATSYAVTGTLPAGLTLNSSTGAITGSPTTPGTFTVGLTATGDGGTSLPQPLVITINPALGVPVITSPAGATGTAGANFNYTITASNMPAAPFPPGTSLDAVNLPSGLAVNPATGVIQGVPAVAGTTTASLFGTNAAGTGSPRDLVITVQPPLTAPVINSGTVASGQVGANFAYTITATNTPSSFEVLGAPSWMTVNSATGAVAGTPTAPGSITVQLVAANSAGTSTPVPLTLNIGARTGTPSVGSARNVSGQVDAVLVTYQILADNSPTSYAALGLPPGVVVNTATGAITGTPTVSGTFPVLVSASNAVGAGAPVVVTFTIAPSASLVAPGN